MDIGLDLLANPLKIKKKNYFIEKGENFDLSEFILETMIDELNINTHNHPKNFLKKVIDFTLKISNEDKNVDISHLENFKLDEKSDKSQKLPMVLTKKIPLTCKIVEEKDKLVDVKKLPSI